jgi:hypothetical protein
MTTNETVDLHSPTPEFRDYLEGEVIREYRHRRTFRRLRAAAVIIVSVGIGMTATLASAQVRESSVKDSLLAAAQSEAMLLKLRLDLARAQVAEEQKQIRVGARPAEDVPSMVMLRELEAASARLKLNMTEIEATARSPRDELNAPLVNGRDFVRERLEVALMIVQVRLIAAEHKLADAERRVRVGAASPLESADYQSAAARLRAEVAVAAERLRAREEFLGKGTSVHELTVRIERTEVEQAIHVAQQELVNTQARLQLIEQRHKAGASTDLELLEAQVNVKIQQLDLQKLMQRLQKIRASGDAEGNELAGGSSTR